FTSVRTPVTLPVKRIIISCQRSLKEKDCMRWRQGSGLVAGFEHNGISKLASFFVASGLAVAMAAIFLVSTMVSAGAQGTQGPRAESLRTEDPREDSTEAQENLWRMQDSVPPAEDPNAPRRHFRITNPNRLSNEEAEQLYADLRAEMAQAYGLADLAEIADYQSWTRYNTAPYRSAAHGNRYVNNYANNIARAYGNFERAGDLPAGAIVAKDNLTVTADGTVSPGALLVMEKMPAGFNFISGDWRYTMVMPDGSIFGTTNGEGSRREKFCITCHLAAEQHDHLFFVPEAYRR
ncbi:MAG: cytochrome P460 family protein, partial [Fimbriimonadaceae bacterium]|nr:cytochrome P460 family protein [Alphaproteobacteria bacterium]